MSMKKTILLLIASSLMVMICSCGQPAQQEQPAQQGQPAQQDQLVDWTTSESGLQWRDLAVGEGAEAAANQTVDVHYTGWLYVDGQKGDKFDSSVDRGQPFSFLLGTGKVIKGWDEGVAGMKVGGKRELLIPPDIGYGERGHPPVIPPNSTLLFEVELLNVR